MIDLGRDPEACRATPRCVIARSPGAQVIASIFFTTRCTVSQVRVVMSLP